MSQPLNPAYASFLASIQEERIWCEVLIQRKDRGFLLRHKDDRELSPGALRHLNFPDLRRLATFSASGAFRPLRSAPDLQRGWYFPASTPDDFARALQELYPGSVPDWFAAQSANPPVTDYREFTGRQSGMYRITQLLSDEQAALVTRAACASEFCLKRRLWSVPGLPPDRAETKSEIPCLEPCAVLLELARKAARIEQEEKLQIDLSPSDLETVIKSLDLLRRTAHSTVRIGDVASPTNPRRLQLLLEKLSGKMERPSDAQTED